MVHLEAQEEDLKLLITKWEKIMENKAERNKTRNLKKMNQGNRVGSLKDK